MDEVHRPASKAWIDVKAINIRKWLEEWATEFADIESVMNGESGENALLKSLVSEEEYEKIKNECRPENLLLPKEYQFDPEDDIDVYNLPEGAKSLATVRHLIEDYDERAYNAKYAKAVERAKYSKYANYPAQPDPTLIGITKDNKPIIPVTTPEVVLTVQLFVPERRVDRNIEPTTTFPSYRLDHEFFVIGCQYLSELRDKIICVSDQAIPGDYSDCPTVAPPITCKELYKSGFFYINGVFYNDMRDKDCRDYSEIIREWAEKRKSVGPFKSEKMEEAKFIDLEIKLGYPYLYTHQGNCEHLMVFNDLSVFNKQSDVNNRSAYPVYSQIRSPRQMLGMCCQKYPALWLVYDNPRLPENPFFFCKRCFFSFNYDKDNQKIGEFRAYHFPALSKLN